MIEEAIASSRCAVVTDAGCDLAPELLGQLGVRCCSADASAEELSDIYRQLVGQGAEEIVSMHAGPALAAARQAAPMVGAPVTAVDACFMSAGLALLVERAAHAAAQGCSAAQIADRVEALSKTMEMYVVFDSHTPLRRGRPIADRLLHLRRRALAERCLVHLSACGPEMLASSTDLTDLTGRVAHAFGARARADGALCYIEAGNDPAGLFKLKKPFDTNEYVSHRLATLMPAPALSGYAGPAALAVAVVPEQAFGGHKATLFDTIPDE